MTKKLDKTAPERKAVTISLTPSLEPKLGRVYSNYVQVAHTQYEFTIRFGDFSPLRSEDLVKQKSGDKIIVPNIVEIIITPDLIPEVMKALETNYTRFLENFRGLTKEEEGTEDH
ncbi:MAG: DUF3467 domain-containing protein [Proteobacteria bacterium]|nr:DUF3467 domain-containing protein [Pseudomonadota bacterium]MBU4357274.1 DUF3467 domain-containing protein [Pseudomonadota bacterium]MBU4447793.1 DUF3467 domain-containing protein [Pseudomonadota bacterium]MCG2771634.1 DUF3467 domain-containing protein [Desulfobacterales bacterium]